MKNKTLTVKELIEKLQKIKNQDSQVYIENDDLGDFKVVDTEEVNELYTYLVVE